VGEVSALARFARFDGSVRPIPEGLLGQFDQFLERVTWQGMPVFCVAQVIELRDCSAERCCVV